jgi:hypothetical protein
MSELGFGDELLTSDDMDVQNDVNEKCAREIPRDREEFIKREAEERERKQRRVEDVQTVGALPIVVIRNYASKGGTNREEVLDVLASWAATLAENQVGDSVVCDFVI